MADWTNITNQAVGVGGLPSGTTVTALRDNPVAIAEGAAGAPRVDLPAIVDALAAVPAGSRGSYVWARRGSINVNYGDTAAGSSLQPTSAVWEVGGTGASADVGSALSGTWRCMGRNTVDKLVGTEPNRFVRFATLWLRIS